MYTHCCKQKLLTPQRTQLNFLRALCVGSDVIANEEVNGVKPSADVELHWLRRPSYPQDAFLEERWGGQDVEGSKREMEWGT